MKAERRHELQHNEVADWLAATIERIKPYSRAIVAVAVAATVLLITYIVLSGRSQRKQSVAWTDYYEALQADSKKVASDLESVVREHQSVPAGLWAKVALSDLKLGEGIDSLFRDKQAAQTKLRSAVQLYQEVVADADDALLAARARFGLARAQESLGRLDEAREVYEQIVKASGTNAYVSAARDRLKDLDRSSTKDFYAWFAKQEPAAAPPPSDFLPGTPGERLPFESGSLGSPGGLNLPGDNILNIPPLDKAASGPLLTPLINPDEPDKKDAKDATDTAKPTDQSEKDSAKGEADKDKDETDKADTDKDDTDKDDTDKDEKKDADKVESDKSKSQDSAKDEPPSGPKNDPQKTDNSEGATDQSASAAKDKSDK